MFEYVPHGCLSGHRADEVESEIFDLFIALSTKQTSEDLLDYPLLYAAGRQGWSV